MTTSHSGKDEDPRVSMERYFGLLDALVASRGRVPILKGSDFQGDHNALDLPSIQEWATALINIAVDHLKTFRLLAGKPPRGRDLWPVYAGWTLLRSALETSCQAIWLARPIERNVRLERVLRIAHDDHQQFLKAVRLSGAAGTSEIVGLTSAQVSEAFKSEAIEDALPGSAQRIVTRMNIVECIEYAAEISEIVRSAEATALWRTASGYAHGRLWAHDTTGESLEIGLLDDRKLYYQTVGFEEIYSILWITVEFTRYANFVVRARSGHRGQFVHQSNDPPRRKKRV